MNLIGLLVFVIVLGLIYWCVTLLPLPDPFKKIAMVILILIAIIWLVSSLGFFGPSVVRLR